MGKPVKNETTVETVNLIVIAESFLAFVPKKETIGTKKGFIPCKVRRITINDKRSNTSWKYCMTVRKGSVNISDSSRMGKNSAWISASVSMKEMRENLSRMVGADNANKLIDTMTM